MKKRIIPSVLLRGGTNVTLSQQFQPWRTVGALIQQLRLHINRNCDELLIVNLDLAGSNKFNCNPRLFSLIRQEVDIPISYVGGIRSEVDASLCINNGFDKIYITSAFLDNTEAVTRIASVIGSQSIGVSLPYKRDQTGAPFVWDYRSSSMLPSLPLQRAIDLAVSAGCGELFLHNVTGDGLLKGLDHSIHHDLSNLNPSIPILIGGGATSSNDICNLLSSPYINGIVASSLFSLTQETPSTIRDFCQASGIPMRQP